MSAGSTVVQTPENENGARIRGMQCPLYGCKRVYSETSALESHIKDHEIPAQSLPGKVLRCSTVGCSGSFPNMQKLMEHMRQHHKPNIYFQCESCRTKLRTYRNLLGHLRICSKVPRGKPKAAEAAAPTNTTLNTPNTNPKAMEQAPPQLESAQQVPFQVANPAGSLPGDASQPGSSEPPVLGPPILPRQEPPPPKFTPPQLTEAVSQPPVRIEAANLPPTINLAAPKAAPDVPNIQNQFQTQSRSPEAVHPAPVSVTAAPPGSSAVWKKNQGLTCNRRVLWEHTRGRYTCIQCGHTVTNRKDMNHHIKSQHSGKAAENTGSSATSSQ